MTLLNDPPITLDRLRSLDPEALRELAIELNGRPVPGVRMTAEAFEAWAIDHADAEWANGRIYLMSPANIEHNNVQNWLARLMADFAEGHEPVHLATDVLVRLSSGMARLVPDLLVVKDAHASRIRPTYIDGPPDLVVEIVSPDSQDRDRREKFQEYQAGGVPEYWIVDPVSKRFDAFRLRQGAYELKPAVEDRIECLALPGLYVRPSWLLGEKLPKVRDCLAEIEQAAAQTPEQAPAQTPAQAQPKDRPSA